MGRNILCLTAIVTFILGLIFVVSAVGQMGLVKDPKEFESWKVVSSTLCSGTHTHFYLEKDGQRVEVLAITPERAELKNVVEKLPAIQLQGEMWYVYMYRCELGGVKYVVRWNMDTQEFDVFVVGGGNANTGQTA